MNSKRIGNIGEVKVLSKFVELGIPVYIPFGDNEKADLIAEFHGKLNKIQVKTSSKTDGSSILFNLTTSTTHRTNGYKHKYSPEEVDYFALYNLERNSVYLVKNNKDKLFTNIRIRFVKPKNNQIKDINLESDYLLENVLQEIIL